MPDRYKIIWSHEALNNVISIITYIENKWGKREADNFLENLRSKERILSFYPEAFTLSESTGYRRCVLTEQTSIIYKFENESVIIHSVFDNRQNPDKLKS